MVMTLRSPFYGAGVSVCWRLHPPSLGWLWTHVPFYELIKTSVSNAWLWRLLQGKTRWAISASSLSHLKKKKRKSQGLEMWTQGQGNCTQPMQLVWPVRVQARVLRLRSCRSCPLEVQGLGDKRSSWNFLNHSADLFRHVLMLKNPEGRNEVMLLLSWRVIPWKIDWRKKK